MKTILLTSALLLLAVALLLSFATPTDSYALKSMFPSSPPTVKSTTYVDDVYGFQFDVPKNWQSVDFEEFIATFMPNDGSAAGISLMYIQLPNVSLEDWEYAVNDKEERKLFESEVKDGLISSLAINQKTSKPKFTYYSDGVKITLTASGITVTDEGNIPMKISVVAWYLPETGDTYYMMYAADKTTYKKYLSSFQKSVKSFYVYESVEEFEEDLE
jgi:hypothetical protein